MAESYKLFTVNKVFGEREVNEMCDKIFDFLHVNYSDKIEHLFIGGGVGLILQGREPYLIKDIDLIVTNREVFEKLSEELPKIIDCEIHRNYLRFWVKTKRVWFEFWFVDKEPNLVHYNGIPLELNTDILKYK